MIHQCVSMLLSTSLKYSKPSLTDGSRLLLVCDVALGRCQDVHRRDVTLTQAPEGRDSVHGVSRASEPCSEFEVGLKWWRCLCLTLGQL